MSGPSVVEDYFHELIGDIFSKQKSPEDQVRELLASILNLFELD
jgi:hypothetical protein